MSARVESESGMPYVKLSLDKGTHAVYLSGEDAQMLAAELLSAANNTLKTEVATDQPNVLP